MTSDLVVVKLKYFQQKSEEIYGTIKYLSGFLSYCTLYSSNPATGMTDPPNMQVFGQPT